MAFEWHLKGLEIRNWCLMAMENHLGRPEKEERKQLQTEITQYLNIIIHYIRVLRLLYDIVATRFGRGSQLLN